MCVNLKNHSHQDVRHMSMEEFDLVLFENSKSFDKEQRENLWMCCALKVSIVTEGFAWCKDAMYNAYVPILDP